MFPDNYPYTNFHELNLGYFIIHFREIFSQWADLYDQMRDWKNATTDELAAWKTGVEADLDQREAALRAELETWKAQTGLDIDGWEDATLAALTAWQTATQAVFEAIRVEAAGSASAAAASAGDAAIAKTAAETAQAAAEAAAASVQASAAQITTNTEDIADLKTQINHVYSDGDFLVVTQAAMLHSVGDGTVVVDANNKSVQYTRNTAQANYIGFSFASEVGKEYTASFVVHSGTVQGYAVKGTTMSTTTYLARSDKTSSGKVTMTFTATTTTTTIWLTYEYTVTTGYVTGIKCSDGWSYANLDTHLTSDKRPAQGKAVGSVRNRVKVIEDKMDSIIDDENLITVNADTVLHTGNSTITITDDNGFTSTNSQNTNNLIGLAFTTQAKKQYTIKFKVVVGTVLSCYLCTTRVYNAQSYIMTWNDLADTEIEYTFTAVTGTTSIWFNQLYDMPVITVNNFYCSDGILRYKYDIMDYRGDEIVTFNKILCIGDSITEGTFNYTVNSTLNNVFADAKYSYPTYLKAMTGRDVYNHGHGGYTAKQWYDTYGNSDLSGYDACIIMLGINDGVQEVGIEQFSTNMTNIINKVMTDNNGIRVFVATIVPAYSDYDTKFNAYIDETKRLVEEDFTNAFLVDINKYSKCKYGTYYAHGHLTAIGYQELAKEFYTLISYIMHNDLESFKGIQFIGTNYEW